MSSVQQHIEPEVPTQAPPWSRLVQLAAGACLVLAALTNGLSQYVGYLVIGDLDFSEQIRWGAEHAGFQGIEQGFLVVSALFMPLGLLGVAQVTRWNARRLTLVAVPLVLWGMWGFHNVIAMGYVSGTVAPAALSVDDAVRLNDAMVSEPGVVVLALIPHLIGSFFGVLLLAIAAWRSGAFPKAASVLVMAFLVWDFFLPPVGPIEAHLLLTVGWTWWGITLMRLPNAAWRGQPIPTRGGESGAY